VASSRAPYARTVSDAEHELLIQSSAQAEEIARLRALVVRVAGAAIDAQERAEGRHEAWLDEALADVEG
jgi:hypothetical protein